MTVNRLFRSLFLLTAVSFAQTKNTAKAPTEESSKAAHQAENQNSRMDLILRILESTSFGSAFSLLDTGTHWVPWNSRSSGVPANAVYVGQDEGDRVGRREIYVCRANVPGAGLLPGKWVVGRCNVAWGRREYVINDYEVAVSTLGCWGWPHESWGPWLKAGQWPVCRVHYLADRGFHIGGPAQNDYGMQGGRLVGTSCAFGWDGGAKEVVLPEVYYPTCPGDLRRPPPPSPGPAPGGPKIASMTITPSLIREGEQATLTVTLDQAAPAGGFVVGISHVTNTGVDDVIVSMPQSLPFMQGARVFPFAIRTQRRTQNTTDIVFTAFHGADQKSAQLTINP
jgi:hypothetical protein